MRVGIAVHSKTGASMNFAGVVADRLRGKGHTVEILPLEPRGSVQPHQSGVELKSMPDCSSFDILLVGGPIWAFGMSPVALAFAAALGDLSGKKAIPFATMGAKLKFMGGYQGIASLSRKLVKTGATVLPGVIAAAWACRSDTEKSRIVERVAGLLGS